MNNYRKISVGIFSTLLLACTGNPVWAQSFSQGSFNIGLSGGSTTANYSTKYIGNLSSEKGSKVTMDGIRDPLTLEYGLTNHLGVGLSIGGDIFKVDPAAFYGFSLPSKKPVEVTTSEFLLDFNYHFYSNEIIDFSTFASIGSFSVYINGKEKLGVTSEAIDGTDEFSYNYTANGRMFRTGLTTKLYLWRRVGIMGMVSIYNGECSPKRVEGNTVGNNYSTQITGFATEFGICFHFF